MHAREGPYARIFSPHEPARRCAQLGEKSIHVGVAKSDRAGQIGAVVTWSCPPPPTYVGALIFDGGMKRLAPGDLRLQYGYVEALRFDQRRYTQRLLCWFHGQNLVAELLSAVLRPSKPTNLGAALS